MQPGVRGPQQLPGECNKYYNVMVFSINGQLVVCVMINYSNLYITPKNTFFNQGLYIKVCVAGNCLAAFLMLTGIGRKLATREK